MSKIIIQNLKQLKAISQLMVECVDTAKAIKNKDISFSLDLKEVLNENKFHLSIHKSENRHLLDFHLNNEILYSFDFSNNVMTEYSLEKDDETYEIEDSEDSFTLSRKEMKSGNKSFLKISNEKDKNKDLESLKIKKPLHSFAVFGF